MTPSQRRAMIVVALIAVLALPAYLIVGIATIPLGIGLLMLTSSSPWILNLYPFLFAGTGSGSALKHYIDTVVSLPLTVVQWIVIAWLAGIVAREREPRAAAWYALGVVLVFGLIAAAVLGILGIRVAVQAGHM